MSNVRIEIKGIQNIQFVKQIQSIQIRSLLRKKDLTS